jgi:hypothetical protein
MRKRKVFGLILIAVLAIAALVASTGRGEEGIPTFTTDSEKTTMDWAKLKDEGAGKTNALTVGGKEILCKEAIFTGTIESNQTTEFTVEPTYKMCETEKGEFVTVTSNSCKYVFHISKKVAAGHYRGPFDVVCPGTSEFEVHVYATSAEGIKLCTFKIGSQSGLNAATYTNIAGAEQVKDEIKVEGTIENLKYVTEGACGNLGSEGGIRHFHMTVAGTDSQGKNSGIRMSGE